MTNNAMIRKIKWMPLPRTEKAEGLHNPYCGWYSIFGFNADSEILYQHEWEIENIPLDSNEQICLLEINLLPYNDRRLPESALQIINRIFGYFSKQGKQMIVRFVYDWEGKGVLSEPKDIEIILNHMSQLSNLLKEYTHHIYILQGLFIGSWGEMHNSRYLSERHMVRLAKQLYECSGDKTQIALRCPSYWRMVFKTYQPLDAVTAFTDIQKARFSLFNDGIMASDTDLGTYGSVTAKDSATYGDRWIRRDELEFQNQLCQYVSNGGEVVGESRFNDVPSAIGTLRKMRVSYLHRNYDKQVLDKWKANKSGVSDALWKDRTGYEYMEAHLGYRFTLEDANLSVVQDRSGKLRASVEICNKGFAPCYHKYDVKFMIRTASYSEVYECAAATDTREWMPNEKVVIEAVVSVGDWKSRQYILSFGIYDSRTKQPIRIAKTFSSMDHIGYYSLGNFVIVN